MLAVIILCKVRLYKLSAKSGEVSCHVVTEAGKQGI